MNIRLMIKNFAFIICFLASSSKLLADFGQDPRDASKILGAIRSNCLDSWCEGAFDINFNQVIVRARAEEVEVRFRMSLAMHNEFSFEQPNFKAEISRQSHDVSCKLSGYSQLADVLRLDFTLTPSFRNSLSDCVETLSSALFGNPLVKA